MKLRTNFFLCIMVLVSIIWSASYAYAQLIPFYPPVQVWAVPAGGFYYGQQTISLHTNYPKSESEEAVKIFYTYDIHGALHDLYEYTEPLTVNENTEIWFFAIVSPEEETDIMYQKYNILSEEAQESAALIQQPVNHDICITEVSPREKNEWSDWIEIKNYGKSTYFLGGWYVETKQNNIPLPQVHIDPNQMLSFQVPLRSYNDVIRVYSRNNELMDVFEYKHIVTYLSTLGRKEFRNGKGCFKRVYHTDIPTQNVQNVFTR